MGVLTVKPVRVAVDGSEEHGLLVLCDDVLVAVLTCLANPMHGEETGRWYLEAGFGRCAVRQSTFATLDDALRWVAGRLGLEGDAAVLPALDGCRPPHAASDGTSSAI